MAKKIIAACMLAAAAATLPAIAQMPKEAPGKPDPARVTAGTYKADPNHSQVAFALNHLGFSIYHGLFGGVEGTLTLDPAKPAVDKVSVDIPISSVLTTSEKLTEELKSDKFFDAAKFPTAHFESTSVSASGTGATIQGKLTLKGVTKPVTLKAHFTGAGPGMMGAGDTVGFEATTKISRSAFGVSYGVPLVGDSVDLEITAAFAKVKA